MTKPSPTDLQTALATAAARNLATSTKTQPQMQGISSRWLLKLLPWVQVNGGVYRVNRRLTCTVGDGRLSFYNTGSKVQVVPQELRELPLLRGFENLDVLGTLADRFVQRQHQPGEVLVAEGGPADHLFLIVHGKVDKVGRGKYGDERVVEVLADGDHFSQAALLESGDRWSHSFRALTPCVTLSLSQAAFEEVVQQSSALAEHLNQYRARLGRPQNTAGEAEIALSAGHFGEPAIPGTFVDYELKPREYELSVAQTVLQVHTRVADLYNQPMNQVEQQLRLTIEALRERQEQEMVNNSEFGLLHNADVKQRIHTMSGPPTPDDMDDLLSLVWKEPSFFLAHPRAISAFGQECSRRGIYPTSIDFNGNMVPAWRGIPIFPCNKLPVSTGRTTSILLMRAGEANQGVVGLHQTGLPDEVQPGLSARFMGINEKAIMSYLVTAYYSTAVLVPDALAVLDNVEIGRV